MYQAADDPETQARHAAFLQGLQEAGWAVGRNIRIDSRWGGGDTDRTRRYAAELVALAPDVILASGSSTLGPLQQVTRTVPIVFAAVADPVGGGFVESLARPGGNITGFELFEYSIGGKWLEHLKQIAPRVTRVAVLRDATLVSGGGQLGAIQSVAPSFGVQLSPVGLRDVDEIESAVAAFARAPNGGLILTASGLALIHRDLIVTLAARHKLPAVYWDRFYVTSGGLMSYGPDSVDTFRRAASLCRADSQGRQARRSARPPVLEIRIRHQSLSRARDRHSRAAVAHRPSRRGYRVIESGVSHLQ
jgi:putative ABC transport system substrate-binding protein